MTSRRTRFPLALCAGLAVSLAGLSGCDELFPYRSPGEVVFRKRCAECHGIDARGNTPRFMGNPYTDLRDNTWRTAAADEGAIGAVIEAGVFGQMPAFSDQLTPEQIRQVTHYLQEMRGERTPEPRPK